jgi:uncharacterized membrane protein YbhN (UPF0104 family)
MTGQPPSSRLKGVLAWALALAALAFIAHAVPLRDVCTGAPGAEKCEPGLLSTLGHARAGVLLAMFALYVAGTFAWAMRYRALLGLAQIDLRATEAWRITLESQAGGVLLPGGIGGDALRIAFVLGKGAPATTVAAAVLLDRALGLATVAGLAASMAGVVRGGELGPTALVLAAVPLALLGGLAVARWKPVAEAAVFRTRLLRRVAEPVLAYLGHSEAPGAVGRALGFSVVVSAIQLVVIRGIVSALGAAPSHEPWVYLGATMSFIVNVLPALPGGWGTSDAAFVFFLGKAGLVAGTALAVSLLYRLFWYACGAAGAVLYLLRRK